MMQYLRMADLKMGFFHTFQNVIHQNELQIGKWVPIVLNSHTNRHLKKKAWYDLKGSFFLEKQNYKFTIP